MRFMMLMIPKGYEQAAPGTMPDAKAVDTMMKYNEELQKAGVLLALEGLHPPSMGARVSFAGGKPKVTDGPFAEATEVLGGFWMIQVKSKEEAIQWATRCPASAERNHRSPPDPGDDRLPRRSAEGSRGFHRDANTLCLIHHPRSSCRKGADLTTKPKELRGGQLCLYPSKLLRRQKRVFGPAAFSPYSPLYFCSSMA